MRNFILALVFVLLLGASLPAKAQVVLSLGQGLSWEHTSNARNFETNQPRQFRLGYGWTNLDLYLEYSTFQKREGTTILQITRTHQEALAWSRYRFRPDWLVTPYAAAAVGANFDSVRTDFYSQSVRNQGQPELTGALASGVSLTFHHFEAELEPRLTLAASYSPNPLLSLALFAGYRF